jgi:hypothetical protein
MSDKKGNDRGEPKVNKSKEANERSDGPKPVFVHGESSKHGSDNKTDNREKNKLDRQDKNKDQEKKQGKGGEPNKGGKGKQNEGRPDKQQNYENRQQNFDKNLAKNDRQQNRGERQQNRGDKNQADRHQNHHDKQQNNYDRPQNNYDRQQNNYDRQQNNYDRQQNNYDRQQNNHDRQQNNHDRQNSSKRFDRYQNNVHDQDYGEWNNGNRDGRGRGRDIVEGMATMSVQGDRTRRQQGDRGHNQNQGEYEHINGRHEDAFQQNGVSRGGYNNESHQQQGPPPQLPAMNVPPPSRTPVSSNTNQGQPPSRTVWKTGDQCLAKYWEDEQFYPVSVTGVTSTTAVVLFSEYGNFEEVLLSDLVPLPGTSGQGGKRGRSNIPPTPGLPPAFRH